MSKTSPRDRLYSRVSKQVAERLAEMGEAEAAEWVSGHGLLGLARDPRLPAGVRERLLVRAREIAAYNLYAVSRFQEVADALAGLPVCPLKGIFLLDRVYRDDPESRPLSDLDLLVPAERIGEAVARLRPLGLRETTVSRRLGAAAAERVLADDRLTVEVHSRLAFKHAARSTWHDLAPAPGRVHGRDVYVLDPETTLVHLVTHLVKHRPFSRLGWVEDVLRWIESGVDGGRSLRCARALGAFRSFVAGVRMLRHALGPVGLPEVPPAPPGVAGRLAVHLNERLLWRDLVRDPWRAGPGTPTTRTLSVLLLADGPGDAWRFAQAKLAEIMKR